MAFHLIVIGSQIIIREGVADNQEDSVDNDDDSVYSHKNDETELVFTPDQHKAILAMMSKNNANGASTSNSASAVNQLTVIVRTSDVKKNAGQPYLEDDWSC